MNMLTEAAVEKALDHKMSNVPYKMIGKDVTFTTAKSARYSMST